MTWLARYVFRGYRYTMLPKNERDPPAERGKASFPYIRLAIKLSAVLIIGLIVILVPYFVVTRRYGHDTRVVNLGYSQYRGHVQGNIRQWLGLRYAAPPLGPLRFAAPQDPVAHSKVQWAKWHGPRCLGTGARRVNPGVSEDCLFLDVYAPANATSKSLLPVYFWIQGGGFNANTNANYNGAGLIHASGMKIVVVTLNYRVGPYGFLASKEVAEGGSMNNGLKDQIKALHWVKKYINQFGGNPDHVVIGGDSAGGASVTLLMAAHGGRNDGLFHGAAAESQSFGPVLTVAESQYQYDTLVNRTQCTGSHRGENSTLSCLRSLSVNYLQSQNIGIPYPGGTSAPLFMYGPTIDNDLIPDLTVSLFRRGRYIRVPSIFGDVTNEGTIFTPKGASNIDDSNAFLQNQFPALNATHLSRIQTLYPVEGTPRFPFSGTFWRQVSNAYGELRYICPGLFLSSIFTADNGTANSVWNYRYDVEDPLQMTRGYGVPHVSDVYAIFGPDNTNGGAPASLSTGRNQNIIPVIQGYWTSFIRSLDPNKYRLPGSPNWDAFTQEGRERVLFQTNHTRMEVVGNDQRERCEYLSSIAEDIQQ